jgi:hypothetical protein
MSRRTKKTDNKKDTSLPMTTFFQRHIATAALLVELSTLSAVLLFMIAATLNAASNTLA